MLIPILGVIVIGVIFLVISGTPEDSSNIPADNVPSSAPLPLEDKIKIFAEAIAQAEGFYVNGSVPQRAHNPGDLGPGDVGSGYPLIHAVGSDVSQLPDDQTGWELLYAKLRRIFTGASSTYNIDMTIEQIAMKYAGDWRNWANNVARALGVPSTITLREWLAQ